MVTLLRVVKYSLIVIIIVVGIGAYLSLRTGCTEYEQDSEHTNLYKCVDELSVYKGYYYSDKFTGNKVYYPTKDRNEAVIKYLSHN